MIKILDSTNETEDYYLNRYIKIKNELHEMLFEIRNETYPRNYEAIPLFHLVDNNADSADLYKKVCEINDRYISNYRSKDEAVLMREMVTAYLCGECGMSKNRAKSIVKGLGRHKEVYYEFVFYVKNRYFTQNAVEVRGYTADFTLVDLARKDKCWKSARASEDKKMDNDKIINEYANEYV